MKKEIVFIILLLNCFTLFGQKTKRFEYGITLDYKEVEVKDIVTLDSINAKPGQLLIQAKYRDGSPGYSLDVTIESKSNYSSVFTTDRDGLLQLNLEEGCYFIKFDFEDTKRQVCIGKNGLTINVLVGNHPSDFTDSLGNYYIIRSKVRLSKSKLREIKKCLETGNKVEDCNKKFKIFVSYQI